MKTPLLGLPLLLAIAFVASCRKEAEKDRLLQAKDQELNRMSDYESDVQEAKDKIQGVSERYEKAADVEKGIQNLIDARRAAILKIEESEKKIKDSAILLEAYRKAFRDPQGVFSPGQNLGDLILKDGTSLKGAVVTQANAGRVGLRHSAGVGTFPLENLPDALLVNVPMRPILEATNVETDPLAVLKKRPNSLKTSAQIALEQKQARDLERGKSIAAADAEREARNESAKKKTMEEEAARQRLEKIRDEIDHLEAQIERYRTAITAQEQSKTELSAKWSGLKVKPSIPQQQRELGVIATKIAELNRSILSTEARVRELEKSLNNP